MTILDTSTLAPRLAAGLAAMQIDLDGTEQARLLAYLALLAKWNQAYNLTAVRDATEMVPRHLLDSLAALPYIHGTSLADIGSGGGLPGIPLAIARPDLNITLIESNGKKARFLREAARSLPLPNVRVIEARVQMAAGLFDTVTCRAFASLQDMLLWGAHLLAPGGRWLALKGRLDRDELAAIPPDFRVEAIHSLTVPGVDGERCVIELARS